MEFLYIPGAAEAYAELQPMGDLSDKAEVIELLTKAYEAGGESVLKAISQGLEESAPVDFRNDFYKVFNLHFGHLQRPEQELTFGNQRWRAYWVNEKPDGPLGCFWGHQYYIKAENQEWVPSGGGPLSGNPQTDKEVRKALLLLASY